MGIAVGIIAIAISMTASIVIIGTAFGKIELSAMQNFHVNHIGDAR
jgi:hypothetical protein